MTSKRTPCDAKIKQLQSGTFALPEHDGESVALTSQQLLLILAGVDLRQTRPRRRYQRPASAPQGVA